LVNTKTFLIANFQVAFRGVSCAVLKSIRKQGEGVPDWSYIFGENRAKPVEAVSHLSSCQEVLNKIF